MKTIKTKPVIKHLAVEHVVTQEQVYDIISTPYELQAIIMKKRFNAREQEFPMLRIPNFGIFVVPEVKQQEIAVIDY